MKRETRRRLQSILTFVSFLVAVFATALWYFLRRSGADLPLWLMGVVGYAWTFVAFMLINYSAQRYSKKKHPTVFDQTKKRAE